MRHLSRALLLGAVCAIALVVPVAAAAPTIERIPVDDSRVFPAGTRCDFEVIGERSGTLTIKTWSDETGIVRQTFTWDGTKIVYTNPANGKSVTTLLAGPAISVPNGDGTSTLMVPGNDQAVVAPGQGFIAGRTGLSIAIVDDATGAVLEVLKLAGHQDPPFPAGCVALGVREGPGRPRPPRSANGTTCIAAIWMRLPQVSSRTAVVTGPISVGGCVNRTPSAAQPLELGLDVVDGERGEGDPVGDERLLERLGRRVLVRLEEELHAVGHVGRDDGQPSGLADRDVGLLHEAEDVGVERQRLGLVVDEDAA